MRAALLLQGAQSWGISMSAFMQNERVMQRVVARESLGRCLIESWEKPDHTLFKEIFPNKLSTATLGLTQ